MPYVRYSLYSTYVFDIAGERLETVKYSIII